MRDDTIKKRCVVADNQQRQFEFNRKSLEPALRRFVQVVGRLIEQQYVRDW